MPSHATDLQDSGLFSSWQVTMNEFIEEKLFLNSSLERNTVYVSINFILVFLDAAIENQLLCFLLALALFSFWHKQRMLQLDLKLVLCDALSNYVKIK